MKQMLTAFTALAVIAAPASAAAVVGKPAPNFKLADVNGKPVSLANFRGKTVVIEWNNPECPFVKKHYGSGNMQKTQAAAAKDGVVWLTINSSAPGKQGHMSAAQAKAFVAKAGARPSAYLLDPGGAVGKTYDAKTTPAHVRRQQGGHRRLRRRDRRQADRQPGRRQERPQPCPGGARRAEGRESRVRGEQPPLRLQRQVQGQLNGPGWRSGSPASARSPHAFTGLEPRATQRNRRDIMSKSTFVLFLAAGAALALSPTHVAAQVAAKPVSLGVQFSGNPEGTEAEVVKMLPDRTGAAIGFRVGDILIEAGGKPVSREVLMAYMKEKKEGDQLSFKVRRGGAVVELAGKGMAAPEGAPPLTPQPEE